jgi:hypothetical protein
VEIRRARAVPKSTHQKNKKKLKKLWFVVLSFSFFWKNPKMSSSNERDLFKKLLPGVRFDRARFGHDMDIFRPAVRAW